MEVMASVEKTCAEVREENASLLNQLATLRDSLGTIAKYNTLGKTRDIAILIEQILK